MEKTNKETRNEKLKDQTSEAVDELSTGIKRAARKFFDACTQETVEFFSDVFDKYIEKTKGKIKNKGSDHEMANRD
jgi:type III secretory pathway component EscR